MYRNTIALLALGVFSVNANADGPRIDQSNRTAGQSVVAPYSHDDAYTINLTVPAPIERNGTAEVTVPVVLRCSTLPTQLANLDVGQSYGWTYVDDYGHKCPVTDIFGNTRNMDKWSSVFTRIEDFPILTLNPDDCTFAIRVTCRDF